MEENVIITESEFKQLEDLKKKTSELIFDLGRVEVNLLSIKKEKERLNNQFELLQKEEEDTYNTLKEKYGSGYIDIADGKFIKNEEINGIVMINSEITKNFN